MPKPGGRRMSVESCATRVQRLPSGSRRKRLVRSASTSRVAEATMSSRSGWSCRTPVIACATSRSVRRSWSFFSTFGVMASGDMLLSPVGGFDAMIEKVREILRGARGAGRSCPSRARGLRDPGGCRAGRAEVRLLGGGAGTAAPGRRVEARRRGPGRVRPEDRLPGDPPQDRRRRRGGRREPRTSPGPRAGSGTTSGAGSPDATRSGILVVEKVKTKGGSLAAETLLSLKQDPAFGPVLVLGLGGVLTEWFGELSRRDVDGRPRSRAGVREGLERAVAARARLRAPLPAEPAPRRRRPSTSTATVERLETLGAARDRASAGRPGRDGRSRSRSRSSR